jgi:2-polyprenyl-3-methyl-5-hydroxy-6-metoxy-1,4-benzoquinol methylase
MSTEATHASEADPGESRRANAGRSVHPYEFEIDLESDSTHATVVKLVGTDRRVLELGPATGYMSRVLVERGCTVVGIELDPGMAEQAARYCERVIVGDIDTLDLEAELGDETFDVIVAADVLEHLRDPLDALRRLQGFLVPGEGSFVLSIPNVAHGSVRLALMQGDFSYRDLGLLDRTHLRFFTRESIEKLLSDAELGIVTLRRQKLNIDASEVRFDTAAVPPEMIEALSNDPDATTYQFVLEAVSLSFPGTQNTDRRLQALAERLEEALRERAALELELEAASRELEHGPQIAAARESELRTALIDAHDQLLRRDEELQRVQVRAERFDRAERELTDLRAAHDELWQVQNEAREIIGERDEQIRRLRTRLDRILSSPPARAWNSLGRMPILRQVVARRAAGYEAAVQRSGKD